jgi:hypothetical protein
VLSTPSSVALVGREDDDVHAFVRGLAFVVTETINIRPIEFFLWEDSSLTNRRWLNYDF